MKPTINIFQCNLIFILFILIFSSLHTSIFFFKSEISEDKPNDNTEVIDFPESPEQDQIKNNAINENQKQGCTLKTRSNDLVENNAHGGSWLDSFNDESGIELKNESLLVESNNVTLLTNSSFFNITSTADFDLGILNNVSTFTHNSSIPPGEIQITPGGIYYDGFNGEDEINMSDYSDDWIVDSSNNGTSKIDQDVKYSGNASLRLKTNTVTTAAFYVGVGLEYNHSGAEVYFKYQMNWGNGHYSYLQSFNDKGDHTVAFFGGANNKIRYYDGKTIYQVNTLKPDTWYKVTTRYNFATQKYSGWIDGDTFSNFKVADNLDFYDIVPKPYANNLSLNTGSAWNGVNVTTWFDNFTLFGYPKEGSWISDNITLPRNSILDQVELQHYNLTNSSNIRKLQWFVDSELKAEYNTNITQGFETTIRENDLTWGSFTNISSNFTIKIFLSSNGARSPAVREITSKFLSSGEGILISDPISLDKNCYWDKLIVNKSVPLSGNLNISILNESYAEIPGFENIVDIDEINISSIDSVLYPTLRLKASFSGNITINPTLCYWGVSWKQNNSWRETFFKSDKVLSQNGVDIVDGFVRCLLPDEKIGFVNSSAIIIPSNHHFNTLIINKTEPPGTNISVSLYNIQTMLPITGFQNISENGINLISLDPIENPQLQLRVILYSNGGNTSVLHGFSINWTQNKPPYYSSITMHNSTVYRMSTVVLKINATDIETPEMSLSINVYYRPPGSINWYNNLFSDIRYYNGEWLVNFTPVATSIIGLYDIKIDVEDLFNEKYIQIFDNVITVKNNLPSMPDIAISPNQPLTSDDLTATANNSIDIEGEPITYVYQWYKNDVLKISLISETVGSLNTSKGDKWTCEVTPNDGNPGGSGPPNSISVVIQNTPPIVADPIETVIMKEDEIDDSSLMLSSNFFDIDADLLDYSCEGQLLINVSIEQVTGIVKLTPKPNWFGQEEVIFTANDSISETNETVVIIVEPQNDPPVLIKAGNIYVQSPDENLEFDTFEDSFLNITLIAEDIDGDEVIFSASAVDNNDLDNIPELQIEQNILKAQFDNSHIGSHSYDLLVSDQNGSSIIYNLIINVLNINDMPSVSIITPLNNTHFKEKELIDFGCVYSDQDLLVPGYEEKLFFYWYTNHSANPLGSGEFKTNLFGVLLEPGAHEIKVTVQDKAGKTDEAAITIFVDKYVNRNPSVSIKSPLDGSHFNENEIIEFYCQYSDPDLLESDYDEILFFSWYTNHSAETLGDGEYKTNLTGIILEPGFHEIKVIVRDKAGAMNESLINIVIDKHVNSPPNVTIIFPLNGTHFKVDEEIDFWAEFSDIDLQVSFYNESLFFTWSSNLRNENLGTGEYLNNLTGIKLDAGIHEIKVKVTDNSGASGESSITIIIDEQQVTEEDGNVKSFMGLSVNSWWLILLIIIMIIIVFMLVILSKRKKEKESKMDEQHFNGEKALVEGTFITKPGAVTPPTISLKDATSQSQPSQSLAGFRTDINHRSIQAQVMTGRTINPESQVIVAPKLQTPSVQYSGMPQPQLPPAQDTELSSSAFYSRPEHSKKDIYDSDGKPTHVGTSQNIEGRTMDLNETTHINLKDESYPMDVKEKDLWNLEKPDKISENQEIVEQIKKLGELKEKGLITEEEFINRKKDLLR
jgi:hypothetical protein